jgi:parallel beta-helix repeat protein
MAGIGGAKFYRLGPFIDATGTPYASAKLYHYITGTTNDLDIWGLQNKTGALAQPYISDNTGTFVFYADGDYTFVVKDADDNTLHTWNNVVITADTTSMNDDNRGLATPAAAATNLYQMFVEHDSDSKFISLWINDGTSPAFKKVLEYDPTNRDKLVYPNVFGAVTFTALTVDELKTKLPRHDVKAYGAVGDGSTDDTTAVQAAFTAVATTGGVVYFPPGDYKITTKLTITNRPVAIVGEGQGISTITKYTTDDLIDYNTNDINDTFAVVGLSLYTTKTAGGDAINAFWPASASSSFSNLYIHDVEIGPTPATAATNYWTNGIVVSDAWNGDVIAYQYRGKTNDYTSTSGITVSGNSNGVLLHNVNINFVNTGILFNDNANTTTVSSSFVSGNTGIHYAFLGEEFHNNIIDSDLTGVQYGIYCSKASRAAISGNIIQKAAASSSDFEGISLNSSSDELRITNNYIRGTGSGGTENGIVVADGSNNLIANNIIEDQTLGVDLQASATDNLIMGNLGINIVTNLVTDAGTNNITKENYPQKTTTIASAASITLPASGTLFTLTGTTNVNTINGPKWHGRIIILHGNTDGAKNVVDGAGNIELSGGSSHTLAAGGTSAITLFWESAQSKWLEIGRSA